LPHFLRIFVSFCKKRAKLHFYKEFSVLLDSLNLNLRRTILTTPVQRFYHNVLNQILVFARTYQFYI
jgi:hypothetical protein